MGTQSPQTDKTLEATLRSFVFPQVHRRSDGWGPLSGNQYISGCHDISPKSSPNDSQLLQMHNDKRLYRNQLQACSPHYIWEHFHHEHTTNPFFIWMQHLGHELKLYSFFFFYPADRLIAIKLLICLSNISERLANFATQFMSLMHFTSGKFISASEMRTSSRKSHVQQHLLEVDTHLSAMDGEEMGDRGVRFD